MLRTLFIALLGAVAYGSVSAEAGEQKFSLSGRIEGLRKGDTLRFEHVLLPTWATEPAFDLVVRKPGVFDYRGTQEHDQYYVMTYFPKEGKAKACGLSGKPIIVTGGDRIGMTGTADEIYYCALSGGIYDDPMLAESLRIEDSIGRIRGSYRRQVDEALQRKDTAASREWLQKFNLFYQDNQNNPGLARGRAAWKAYEKANPQGTLYLLVERISSISYKPLAESKAVYETFSPELKESYYGRLYAEEMAAMERLEIGQPAPDFSVVTTGGDSVTRDDCRGCYLLIYHWGMCPGSIYLDGQVRDLHDRYKDKGLKVMGLTESIATIRKVYEGLPEDRKTPLAGTEDIRPVLEKMLAHDWTEVELETDHPDNKSIMKAYNFSGWPFFILIGPDGTIRARGFSEAFFEAREILGKELNLDETGGVKSAE
ncbi:redoxin domain-containing protein [uncultured Rikenella sp.]|uniref:peroxiredoxin family protein n=1 Tax=uncultured Rikenella sp. TaxID=368003 RepID=UPI002639AFD7|nr:redoxin domain-containing protein [uncultured Rikenella sp.]